MEYNLLEYKLISKIGEGTFSEVIKAQNIKTGKLVAIKCMKEKISIDKVSMSTIFSNLVGEEIKRDLSTKKTARAPKYRNTL